MKSYTGVGTGQLETALNDATRGLSDPKLIILFSDIEDTIEGCNWLMNKYAGVDVVGVSGSSYNNGNLVDSSNFSGSVNNRTLQVVAFFDDTEIACGILDKLGEAPLYRIKEFEENLNKVHGNHDNTVCIEFCTTFEENLISTTKTILEKKNIELVGGSVSGAFGRNVTPFVVLNGEKYEDAAVYMFIKNKTGKVRTYRNDTYVKSSTEVVQITKIGGGKAQRTIHEVDGKKMINVFKDRFNMSENDFEAKALDFTINTPLGIVIGEETYVISVKSANADGSVETFKKVYEGGAMTFLEMGDYDAMEKEVQNRIKRDLPKRSFILSVDCLYRFVGYTGNGYLNDYLKGMKEVANHAGYIGVGEQNTHQHVNQTMVCVVFE